jgi:transcription termination factor Rho
MARVLSLSTFCMSEKNTPQELPGIALETPVAKKTAKKAAKKAVKKVAAKKAATKKTATKTVKADAAAEIAPAPIPTPAPAVMAEAAIPAKKAAKKAAKKVARKRATTEAAAEAPAAPVAETPAAPAPTPIPAPAAESPTPFPAESAAPPQYGRVPGGGPVAPRDEQQNPSDAQRERRKRRRKRRRERDRQDEPAAAGRQGAEERPHVQNGPAQFRERPQGNNGGQPFRERPQAPAPQQQQQQQRERAPQFTGPKLDVDGMLEIAPKGFGFLRVPQKNFEMARDDVFVSPEMIRRYGLRLGVWIKGQAQEGPRGLQLVEITDVNGFTPEDSRKLPTFEELKAINPNKRISFETTQDRFTTRVLDLVAPVGRGQRGLIVSPPRSGKTTLLLHIAEAARELHDESLHLMILLVDERPEEVTEFRRCLPGVEIYASSNDEQARNHCRLAELCIERAKRLVEGGKHVFLLMDSITRLARAYNGNMRPQGRGIATGGLTVGSLEIPRRLFAAARNTREAGSLTILATALIQTNSRADEAIFQEFKGTGNMELVLDRKIAENYLFPAVDIFKSGTRREELLLPEHMLNKIHLIRRGLAGHRPPEAMERLLYFMKKFPNNPQMLMEIKG